MRKDSKIYVSAHTGFIGAAVLKALREKGYKNFILRSSEKLDLTNQRQVEKLFCSSRPEYVFLLNENSGGIGANIKYPADFICQNTLSSANVIRACRQYGIKKLLLLGSSCIYPKHAPQPLKETALLTGPLEPTNEAYATAKISAAVMCKAYNAQYKTNFICAIPATVYGPEGHFGQNSHVLGGLVQKFFAAKKNNSQKVKIWGTGKPKREFIYIDDLADACLLLMESSFRGALINIGTGEEISVQGLAGIIQETSGYDGRIIFETKRPDGAARKLLDSSKIRSLGFRPKINLKQGLQKTCAWYENYSHHPHA